MIQNDWRARYRNPWRERPHLYLWGGQWYCEGRGWTQHGATPQEAHSRWQARPALNDPRAKHRRL